MAKDRYDDEFDEDDFEDRRESRSGRRRRDDYGDREIQREAGNKVAAGICGILIGALGIHKFILGMTTPGLIMLLVSILTCGIGAPVMGIIGLIEGIIYLTKSDEDFVQEYVINKKQWF